MRFAGRPSWRLSVGDEDLLEVALWVRDALGLPIDSADVPPPLADSPPRSSVLDGEDLAVVGRDWLDWWRALLALQVARRANPLREGSFPDWVRQHSSLRHGVGGPEDDFAGLADAPALRRATVALFREAHRGVGRVGPQQERPWEAIARVVDEVVAERGVTPGQLDGSVILLPVVGVWWRLLAPGVVLASVEAYLGPDVGDDVVRAALESSIGV
jgi:hypothetical protein